MENKIKRYIKWAENEAAKYAPEDPFCYVDYEFWIGLVRILKDYERLSSAEILKIEKHNERWFKEMEEQLLEFANKEI